MIALAAANVLVIVSLAFVLWKRDAQPVKKMFWPALGLKLLSGIALGLVYTYFYTIGDTFHYLEDGAAIARLARTDAEAYLRFLWSGDASYPLWQTLEFQEPRALFLSKIISVLCLLSADNYWIVSLYFSLAAFAGAWRLVQALGALGTLVQGVGLGAFLFFPSIVFWTSGVIKESLAMACLCFLAAMFLNVWFRQTLRPGQWALVLLALWGLWNLKYYYLAVFLPVTSTALVMKMLVLPRVNFRQAWMALPVWLVVFVVPLYVASLVHPNFYPERFLNVIYENYQAYIELSKPGDRVRFDALQPDALSMLQYVPKALVAGMFRPFIWEGGNIFKMLAAAENLLVLALFVTSVPAWRSYISGPHRLLIVSVTVYVALLCVFLTLSTPNFGTLARYRVGFLPFLLLLLAARNPLVQRCAAFLQR